MKGTFNNRESNRKQKHRKRSTNREKRQKKAAGAGRRNRPRDPSNKDQAGRREGTTVQPQQQSARCHA
jgi:hypothetical protein